MPIYEYQCSSCDYRLEKLQKLSDLPLADCPACNGSTLKKVMSRAAFRLKGSGWYETDFKTGSKKNVTGSPESSGSTDSSSSTPSGGSEGSKSNTESKSGSTESNSGSTESKSNSGKSEKTATPAN